MPNEPKKEGLPKSTYKLEVWPASKIKYAYLHTNYGTGGGTLNNSCMRKKDMQKSLQFYEACNCEIVVVTSNSGKKIQARALLWHNVHSIEYPKGKPFNYLDRIYYTKECMRDYYRDYFNTILPAGTYNSNLRVLKKGVITESYSGFYIKDLDFTKITHCPYTDTFKTLFWKVGVTTGNSLGCGNVYKILKNPKIKSERSSLLDNIHLSSTSEYGYKRELDKNSIKEALSGCWVSKKDCVKVKQYDGYVLKTNIVEIGTKYYSKADNKITETALDGFGLSKDVKTDFLTSETMLKASAIALSTYKKTELSHKKYVINIGDKKYHKKDPNIQQYKRKFYTVGQCNINYDIFNETFSLSSVDDLAIKERTYTKQTKMVPKDVTLIFYNLSWDESHEYIVYTPHYGTKDDVGNSYTLYDGTLILATSKNAECIKRYNRKFYPKDYVIKTHKHQLNLFDNKKKEKSDEINV
jgi:hypothetical protein